MRSVGKVGLAGLAVLGGFTVPAPLALVPPLPDPGSRGYLLVATRLVFVVTIESLTIWSMFGGYWLYLPTFIIVFFVISFMIMILIF